MPASASDELPISFATIPVPSSVNGCIWGSTGAKACVHLISPVHMLWLAVRRQGQGVHCLKVVFAPGAASLC